MKKLKKNIAVYSRSLFKLHYRDMEGNWDYYISETPFTIATIEGLLQLNYSERLQILELLESSTGILSVMIGDKVYGFEYVGELNNEEIFNYRLLTARFEDVSVNNLDAIKKEQDKKREERKLKFQENMKKKNDKKEED